MSTKPPRITLALMDWQREELEALFDRASRAASRGKGLPIIAAQVFPDGMRVAYLPPAKAEKLLRAMGKTTNAERSSAFGRSRKRPAQNSLKEKP